MRANGCNKSGMIKPDEMADRIKAEIVADVRAGLVPPTAATFSDLHDYVDANCYGGSERLLEELDAQAPDTDDGHRAALETLCGVMNPAIEIINAWLQDGGVAKALATEAR